MNPIRFDAAVEQPAEDEAETFQSIEDAFLKVERLQHEKEGHAMRTSHAKATAFLTGELEVLDGLPPELAQGLASRPGRYPALVRFAQGPGELLPDKISTHRGMAVKLLGMGGPRIAESTEQSSQDFVLEAGGTEFIHSTPKAFLTDIRAGVSNAPAMPQMLKSAVSNVARVTNALFGDSSKILSFLGHPSLHPLAENYFSQAPMRWGDHVAKIAFAVSDDTLQAVGEDKIDASDDDNAFRQAMTDFFAQRGAQFDLRVQLCTDLEAMPVEDATAEWSQEDSPYQTVARLILPQQESYSETRRALFDERVSFQPNNSLEAHRPLGGIMRARLRVYPLMAARRMEALGVSRAELTPENLQV